MVNTKKILNTIFIILLFVFFSNSTIVKASEPKFSFYPKGGRVLNKNNGFIVDVLIDSDGEKLTSAQFVVLFDPEFLQLKKAERNNSLFSLYPREESTLDNENGVAMLTGFTQSGASTLYTTGGKPDVFARLTFEVLKEGETTLDWEYAGNNPTFDTKMLKDGSPPINVLNSKPESATFVVGSVILDPSSVNTAVPIDKYILVTGIVLVLFGAFMVFTRPAGSGRKNGTVIVYDEE